MSGIQFTVTLDEAEVDAIIQRATEEVRTLAAKSLTTQLIAPMVKERIIPQATERSIKEEGVPVITWDAFHARVKSQSVTAAALLAQKAEILRYHVNSHLHLRMAKPIAEQFTRQQAKTNLLIRVAREFLGEGTKVTIFTSDNEWRELQYTEPQVLTTLGQVVAAKPEVQILRNVFDLFSNGRWAFKPDQTIGEEGRILRSVKYCCIITLADQKVAPLFWLPRTPELCYLDHRLPVIAEVIGPQPYAVLRKWNEMGLVKGDTDARTTRNMGIRGKSKRLVPFKLEALKALGIDTSWACEP